MTGISRVLLGIATFACAVAPSIARAQSRSDSISALKAVAEELRATGWAKAPIEILPYTGRSQRSYDPGTSTYRYSPTPVELELIREFSNATGFPVSATELPSDPNTGGLVIGAVDVSHPTKTVSIVWRTPVDPHGGTFSIDHFEYTIRMVDGKLKVTSHRATLFQDFISVPLNKKE